MVSTTLKNMKVSWDYYSQYMEENMFQTTNQLFITVTSPISFSMQFDDFPSHEKSSFECEKNTSYMTVETATDLGFKTIKKWETQSDLYCVFNEFLSSIY